MMAGGIIAYLGELFRGALDDDPTWQDAGFSF